MAELEKRDFDEEKKDLELHNETSLSANTNVNNEDEGDNPITSTEFDSNLKNDNMSSNEDKLSDLNELNDDNQIDSSNFSAIVNDDKQISSPNINLVSNDERQINSLNISEISYDGNSSTSNDDNQPSLPIIKSNDDTLIYSPTSPSILNDDKPTYSPTNDNNLTSPSINDNNTTSFPTNDNNTTSPSTNDINTISPLTKDNNTISSSTDDNNITSLPTNDNNTTSPSIKDNIITSLPTNDNNTTSPSMKDNNIISLPTSDNNITSLPTNDINTASPSTNDDTSTSPPTNDDTFTSPPTNDDTSTSPPTNDDTSTSSPTNDDKSTTPTTNDDKAISLQINDDKSISPPTNDNKSTSPPTNDTNSTSPSTNDINPIEFQTSDKQTYSPTNDKLAEFQTTTNDNKSAEFLITTNDDELTEFLSTTNGDKSTESPTNNSNATSESKFQEKEQSQHNEDFSKHNYTSNDEDTNSDGFEIISGYNQKLIDSKVYDSEYGVRSYDSVEFEKANNEIDMPSDTDAHKSESNIHTEHRFDTNSHDSESDSKHSSISNDDDDVDSEDYETKTEQNQLTTADMNKDRVGIQQIRERRRPNQQEEIKHKVIKTTDTHHPHRSVVSLRKILSYIVLFLVLIFTYYSFFKDKKNTSFRKIADITENIFKEINSVELPATSTISEYTVNCRSAALTLERSDTFKSYGGKIATGLRDIGNTIREANQLLQKMQSRSSSLQASFRLELEAMVQRLSKSNFVSPDDARYYKERLDALMSKINGFKLLVEKCHNYMLSGKNIRIEIDNDIENGLKEANRFSNNTKHSADIEKAKKDLASVDNHLREININIGHLKRLREILKDYEDKLIDVSDELDELSNKGGGKVSRSDFKRLKQTANNFQALQGLIDY